MNTVMNKGYGAKLTIDELAEALYEGTGHLQGLAEKLARQHGQGCQALSFYRLMGPDVQNFYRTIATVLIDHAKQWRPNQGSACVLSDEESKRLHELPRVLDENGQLYPEEL